MRNVNNTITNKLVTIDTALDEEEEDVMKRNRDFFLFWSG